MSSLLTVFLTIFFAELGDKTQVATVLYATDNSLSPFMVFIAASAALILSSGLAVLLGTAAEKWLAFLPLKLIAGAGFVIIGLWTIYGHYAAT